MSRNEIDVALRADGIEEAAGRHRRATEVFLRNGRLWEVARRAAPRNARDRDDVRPVGVDGTRQARRA